MIQRLKFTFLVLLAGATAWLAPSARADEWTKQTVLTFNEPVEVPGQVLPAGTYVFKLLDSPSDRTIVQIFNEDQTHLITTTMAIPNYRTEPSGSTVIRFAERPAGSPRALKTWFYPGDNYGIEFVYPKAELQLAKAEPPAPAPAPVAAPEPQQTAVEQPEEPPSVPPVVHEPEVIIAQVMPAENPPPTNDDTLSTPTSLPKTAGNFATIPLLGIAFLAAGFTLRFAAKHA